MPIPTLAFEDPGGGLPNQRIPVRLACMAADWTPALFAEVVLGLMNDGRPLISVYEYDPVLNRTGEVRPVTYEKYAKARTLTRLEQLADLPANHFVWSSDLVWAYSDLIDLTVGRESASGLGINWQPALREFGGVVNDSIDLSVLPQTPYRNSLRIATKACIAQFEGHQGQFKDSKGLRYIVELLRRPTQEVSVASLELIVNPPPADSLGKSINTIIDIGGEEDDSQDINAEREISSIDAIDPESITAYKARLKTLKEEIEDAKESGNLIKGEKLEEEFDFLVKHLKANVDKKGNPRRVDGSEERKRKAISNSITRSLDDIKNAMPALGIHLKESITTGKYCCYEPIPLTHWQITIPAPPLG